MVRDEAPQMIDRLLDSERPETIVSSLTFEQGLELLEELVTRVESGMLTLERSVSSYERGVLLVGRLREQLSGAEERLRTLQKV